MNLETLQNEFKEYAKDIRLNLSTILSEDGAPGLTSSQIFGVALASSYATRSPVLVGAIQAAALAALSDAEKEAAKIAATLMAMNNVYYRALHLSEDPELSKLPARLRMNAIAKPGIAKVDFELYCLAVSAISGCGRCLNAHAAELKKADISREAIHSAIRIASVISAAAQALFIG